MEILINSKQASKIIKESTGGGVSLKIEKLYQQVKEVLEKTGKQIGENLTFLVTWGASIGGMIGPLNDYIQGKYPNLTDMEISLLLTGVITNYYFDNKKLINKLIVKIKELGLSDVFSEVFNKAEELKRSFFKFIESLNITVHKMTNIMSYAFIIPLIPLIYDGVSKGYITENEIVETETFQRSLEAAIEKAKKNLTEYCELHCEFKRYAISCRLTSEPSCEEKREKH